MMFNFHFYFYVRMSVWSKREKKNYQKETCNNNNNFSLVLNKTRHIQHISYRMTTINMLFFVKRRRRCRIELNRLNYAREHFCIIEHVYTFIHCLEVAIVIYIYINDDFSLNLL